MARPTRSETGNGRATTHFANEHHRGGDGHARQAGPLKGLLRAGAKISLKGGRSIAAQHKSGKQQLTLPMLVTDMGMATLIKWRHPRNVA